MLSIKNLHVRVEDKPILKGINLEIGRGEVHAIMGPMVRQKYLVTRSRGARRL